jgi:tRNA nucleotidyltransferase (CCA-adding enzyme)
MHDLGKGSTPPSEWPRHHGHEGRSVELVEQVCMRLKISNDCRDLARMTAREHGNVGRALELRANTMVNLFERCDAFRKPQRFIDMLRAAECDHRGRTGFADRPFPQAAWLEQALNAARAVHSGAIAKRHSDQPQRIPEAIHQARVDAVSRVVEAETG